MGAELDRERELRDRETSSDKTIKQETDRQTKNIKRKTVYQ